MKPKTLVISHILCAVLGGYMVYSQMKSSPFPSQTTIVHEQILLSVPKEIMQLLTQEAPFTSISSEIREYSAKEDDDWWITRRSKDAINAFQTSEVRMRLSGKVALSFDFMHKVDSAFIFDPNDSTLYVALNPPEVIMTEMEPSVLYKNSEVFETDKFKNIQTELMMRMRDEVLAYSKENREFYQKGIIEGEKTLYKLFSPLLKSIGNYTLKEVKLQLPQRSDSLQISENTKITLKL